MDVDLAFLYFLLGRPEDGFREYLAFFARGGVAADAARVAVQHGHRDQLLINAKTEPRLDPLRSDPRFQDLLRRIGFPEG